MATQQGAGGVPAVRSLPFASGTASKRMRLTRFLPPQRPNFTGLWESDEVEARVSTQLLCCVAEL
jgi:hypothetical protein